MIPAQGVEAKDPPKTKYQYHENYKNYYSRRLMIVRHHGESFLFTSGIFYKRGYDECSPEHPFNPESHENELSPYQLSRMGLLIGRLVNQGRVERFGFFIDR